jgi:hypothetical protein
MKLNSITEDLEFLDFQSKFRKRFRKKSFSLRKINRKNSKEKEVDLEKEKESSFNHKKMLGSSQIRGLLHHPHPHLLLRHLQNRQRKVKQLDNRVIKTRYKTKNHMSLKA